MHLNLPNGTTMLGLDAFQMDSMNEHVMAMGDMPGACVARQQDSKRERDGEAQMHLNLPNGTTMLGHDNDQMNAMDE